MTIAEAVEKYLLELAEGRAQETVRAYRNGLAQFLQALIDNDLDPGKISPESLEAKHVRAFLTLLAKNELSPATRQLYMTALRGFLEFLSWEDLVHIDMRQVERVVKRLPKAGYRLPQFPRDQIEKVIFYAQDLAQKPADSARMKRINFRDRAFLLVLADTGLRVHEACKLHRRDIDWNEGRAEVIGKGNKQAWVRFSPRSLAAVKDYLDVRSDLDACSGRQFSSLPIFISHSRRWEAKLRPMTTKTGREIVRARVREVLGDAAAGSITPHTFRHYFVSIVLLATGGNVQAAQNLARHSNVATTMRYAHISHEELDRVYYEIFERGQTTETHV